METVFEMWLSCVVHGSSLLILFALHGGFVLYRWRSRNPRPKLLSCASGSFGISCFSAILCNMLACLIAVHMCLVGSAPFSFQSDAFMLPFSAATVIGLLTAAPFLIFLIRLRGFTDVDP